MVRICHACMLVSVDCCVDYHLRSDQSLLLRTVVSDLFGEVLAMGEKRGKPIHQPRRPTSLPLTLTTIIKTRADVVIIKIKKEAFLLSCLNTKYYFFHKSKP